MKIVHLIPGSGDTFYCENCMRDGVLPRALTALGHESIVAPMYLPGNDGNNAAPVFYGAVGLYLREVFPSLRAAPEWLSRMFDFQPLLRMAGKLSGATDASGLGELTISMLLGEEGGQQAELKRLINWLAHAQPDVVHLSNILLIGVARSIKKELGIPIVCSLQDEHTWLDQLDKRSAERAWEIMRLRIRDVDLFIPVSEFYDRFMRGRLDSDSYASKVVPVGVDVQGIQRARRPSGSPTIGFLSHICEAMGFDILVDAFISLKKMPDFASLKLIATGGYSRSGAHYVSSAVKKATQLGFSDSIDIQPAFGREDRLRFLQQCTVLSVPARIEEALGTFQLESMASGVPVVMPNIGGFAEVVEKSGGGMCYSPNDASALAAALGALLSDPERLNELGHAGYTYVKKKGSLEHMVAGMADAFEGILRS